MRVCLFFSNFGPYHVARIGALAGLCDICPIEIKATSSDYRWGSGDHQSFNRKTLIGPGEPDALVRSRLWEALEQIRPDILSIPGWWEAASLVALQWALSKR